MNSLTGVALVNALIWIGIFFWVWRIDRKLKDLDQV